MPPYRYTLADRAVQAFAACESADARQLLLAFEMLSLDPHRSPRYYGRDADGQMIAWVEAGQMLVGYLADHQAKYVFVLDVRRIGG